MKFAGCPECGHEIRDHAPEECVTKDGVQVTHASLVYGFNNEYNPWYRCWNCGKSFVRGLLKRVCTEEDERESVKNTSFALRGDARHMPKEFMMAQMDKCDECGGVVFKEDTVVFDDATICRVCYEKAVGVSE